MKSISSPKILKVNLVVCILLLLLFVLAIWTDANNQTIYNNYIPLRAEYLKPSNLSYAPGLVEPIIEVPLESEIVYNLDYYLNEYSAILEFFCQLFDYQYDDIINDLKTRETDVFEITNIGYLKDQDGNLETYPNFEFGLIEYFYDLNNNKSKLRNVQYRPYQGDAAYVENLILYFSTIYQNVDAKDLLSIGAAESGYYKVTYMLKYNNVYGGMSSKGLIKHNNIEQGVLAYVRMMSRNYYGQGLTSLEAIGRVYCPVKENGVKKASSHWLKLVRSAQKKYQDYPDTMVFNELKWQAEI